MDDGWVSMVGSAITVTVTVLEMIVLQSLPVAVTWHLNWKSPATEIPATEKLSLAPVLIPPVYEAPAGVPLTTSFQLEPL